MPKDRLRPLTDRYDKHYKYNGNRIFLSILRSIINFRIARIDCDFFYNFGYRVRCKWAFETQKYGIRIRYFVDDEFRIRNY